MAAVWQQSSRCLRLHQRWPAARASTSFSAMPLGVSRPPRFFSSSPSLSSARSPLRGILRVSDEVEAALATNQPVVALESTIYTHGALGMDLRLEAIVRENGGVPAVIGVLDGQPCVGLAPDEIARMIDEGASKVSRRDLAVMTARGRQPGRHGGTTISGTMVLARLAGIRVFGTGGLGGVHRGWHDHMDISADLSELGRTRVAVVSSGCKGFLDISATLEYLETQGVYVATFGDGRDPKAVDFPAFWARESGIPSPSVVADEAEAAAVIWAQERLGIETGLLFANPIPPVAEVPRAEMEAVIDRVVNEAAAGGHTGNRNTPFVLRRIRELTDQRTVGANLALVQANVARAAKMAVHLSALVAGGEESSSFTSYPSALPKAAAAPGTTSAAEPGEAAAPQTSAETAPSSRADVLVAGSVALDLSCDYVGDGHGSEATDPNPKLHTSNPASIVPTVGGVGHNVALAAHAIGSPEGVRVRLCSLVGEDIAGATVLNAMTANGLDTTGVRQLDAATYSSARTAHYVAINGADKNLMVAMADMAIFSSEQHAFSAYWASAVAAAKPHWLVADANWSAAGLHGWIRAARQNGARVAFEPVSVAKSSRLFEFADADTDKDAASRRRVFPQPLVDLATPNQYELAAMHSAARRRGLVLDDPHWFRVIDALGLSAGARERFVRLTSFALTDEGVPQQAVQLLPYIPTLITKLGSRGALVTKLLSRDDPLLMDRAAEPYLLVRAPPYAGGDDAAQDHNDHEPTVGGVYMRLFSPVEQVHDVVSVNGVGDTFLGALVAGLVQGGKVEQLVDVAQRAAVLTLRSRESVGSGLSSLAGALTAAAKGRA